MIEDVQSRADDRGIPLDQAGVSGLRYPIVVLDRSSERQHTVGKIALSVSLPHHFKGTHMSRFIEVLEAHRGELTMHTLPSMLKDLRERLDAEAARVQVSFPYFVEKAAPVSGAKALMDYECTFTGEASSKGGDFVLAVRVPVTSLCPCSKAISDYGAHNQRGYITIELRRNAAMPAEKSFIWIEELIQIAESSASAPVYPLVKRPDERHITMQAYDNPVFVEDMVRNVALKLQADERVGSFHVLAENDESIHNHAAFAQVRWSRPGTTPP